MESGFKKIGPRERLSRYFELLHKGINRTTDEGHEMIHLEEALVDDIDDYERLLKEKHD